MGGITVENPVTNLSNELAKIVQSASASVVAVHARGRFPSSGIHWRPGVIVTAAHTIRREEDIELSLGNGKTLPAQFAGRDRGSDLAALRVEQTNLPVADTGPSDSLQVGHLALVLGRSPNSGPNASLGIVSAASGPWRTWRGARLDQYIRLDAMMFPNSSGGAVLDGRGKVVGIATSALSRMGGLAVPTSTVNRVVDVLLQKGHIPRGFLGVGLQTIPLPEATRTKLALSNQSAVIILSVELGGPAEKGGALVGDILVSLGGTAVEDAGDVYALLDPECIGKQLPAKIIRAGAARELTFQVEERPQKPA
jgi:S1-C subfamily serine protease